LRNNAQASSDVGRSGAAIGGWIPPLRGAAHVPHLKGPADTPNLVTESEGQSKIDNRQKSY